MINIKDKHKCCGCNACANICPKQSIQMFEDEKGFLYPKVVLDTCIDCGLCEKVCPCIHQDNPHKTLSVYAAINSNEKIRNESSSGGLFSMIAEKIILEGGVVFGARFDDKWEVKHDCVETISELRYFRSSKYVQSRIEDTYKKALNYLKEGRKVLFSGTSCQISGLKHYLRKDYDNLLAVEVVCHGVPSPLVWRNYLKQILRPKGVDGKNTVLCSLKETPVLTGISFREKSNGWKKFGFVILGKSAAKADKNSVLSSVRNSNIVLFQQPKSDNYYMQVFLHDLDLRPSCYDCPAKKGKSQSDIALADFWCIGDIHPTLDDDRGISAVLINSSKGKDFMSHLDVELYEQEYMDFIKGNPAYVRSAKESLYSRVFWFFNKFSLYNAITMLILAKRVIDKIRKIIKYRSV